MLLEKLILAMVVVDWFWVHRMLRLNSPFEFPEFLNFQCYWWRNCMKEITRVHSFSFEILITIFLKNLPLECLTLKMLIPHES